MSALPPTTAKAASGATLGSSAIPAADIASSISTAAPSFLVLTYMLAGRSRSTANAPIPHAPRSQSAALQP